MESQLEDLESQIKKKRKKENVVQKSFLVPDPPSGTENREQKHAFGLMFL